MMLRCFSCSYYQFVCFPLINDGFRCIFNQIFPVFFKFVTYSAYTMHISSFHWQTNSLIILLEFLYLWFAFFSCYIYDSCLISDFWQFDYDLSWCSLIYFWIFKVLSQLVMTGPKFWKFCAIISFCYSP